ncbi:hypothetical protein ACWOFR_12150 [Carnobacterium gallinarum]
MEKFFLLSTFMLLSLAGCSQDTKTSFNTELNNSEITSSVVSKKLSETSKYDVIVAESKTKGEKIRSEYNAKEQLFTSAFVDVDIETVSDVLEITEIAVSGVVVNSEPFIYTTESGSEPYTKITLYVNDVLEGDASFKDTEIIIYEAGGIISKRELGMDTKQPEMTTKELDEEVVVNFDGVQNSIPGTEMAAFLVKLPKESLGVSQDFYQFMGNYMTRFEKNDELNEFTLPSAVNGAESEIVLSVVQEEKLNDEVTNFVKDNSEN